MQTKTILIIGLAGAGAFLLWQKSRPAPTAASPYSSFGAGITGILNAGKGLVDSIRGATSDGAASGYTVNAVDHQDDTIVPTAVASSRQAVSLSQSSFSHAVPTRNAYATVI